MVKGFIILSGTGIKDTREWVPSATTALQLVRTLMKQRRPRVRIEDEAGNPVSFFQLKDMADLEKSGRKTPRGPEGAGCYFFSDSCFFGL